MKVCWDCKYWVSDKPEQPDCQFGWCHRFPPQLLGREASNPKVFRMNWCGEWDYKE